MAGGSAALSTVAALAASRAAFLQDNPEDKEETEAEAEADNDKKKEKEKTGKK